MIIVKLSTTKNQGKRIERDRGRVGTSKWRGPRAGALQDFGVQASSSADGRLLQDLRGWLLSCWGYPAVGRRQRNQCQTPLLPPLYSQLRQDEQTSLCLLLSRSLPPPPMTQDFHPWLRLTPGLWLEMLPVLPDPSSSQQSKLNSFWWMRMASRWCEPCLSMYSITMREDIRLWQDVYGGFSLWGRC